MVVAGNLRATVNGQPVQAQTLPQNQVGVASFYVDVPPLNVAQRLDLKALFQKAGVTTENGKESDAAARFLGNMLALADAAGGEAPRPEKPDTSPVRDLQMLSGNAQLLRIHEQKDSLTEQLASWKKSADAIARRWPAWERLAEFHRFASGLPEADACGASMTAITTNRALLSDPDPVPDLTKQLTAALRLALTRHQELLAAAFASGQQRLEASIAWKGVNEATPEFASQHGELAAPAPEPIATDDDILAALRQKSLHDRRNLLDAVPQRFTRALEAASRQLEPKAVKITLPAATISNEAELNAWVAQVRSLVEPRLKDGPVIL